MKSTIVCIRLNADELSWLDELGTRGQYENRSEYLRALLHREASKSRIRSRFIKKTQWDSGARHGRPNN